METSKEKYIDATQLPPSIKHQTIFGMFDELKEGESFILHNDHDPLPLKYQMTATHGDVFTWDYLKKGPEVWELRITRKINYLKRAIAINEDGERILDATQLPPSIKHETIINLFDNLKEGQSFILHNDHDPVPLRYQLLALKGEVFTWDYILPGPDVFEIRIERKPNPAKAAFSVNEKGERVLNATKLPPAIKHNTIIETFDELKEGGSFILVNDHDPKPLQYQLSAMRGDIFTWDYLQSGPVFEIKIGKKEKTVESAISKDDQGEKVIDITKLPHEEQHGTIFRTFDKLKEGESFIIRNDNNSQPLSFQLQAMRGKGVFDWRYLKQEPKDYEIRITKTIHPENTVNIQKKEPKAELREEFVLDANTLPPAVKHETIIETFDQLKNGESFRLLVDHDPKPLYYQLQATKGDIFSWDYLQQGPDAYEVRIAKNK